jgi:hypothetical protein
LPEITSSKARYSGTINIDLPKLNNDDMFNIDHIEKDPDEKDNIEYAILNENTKSYYYKEYIPFISEISVEKIGLRTLGSDIPLVSDARINEMKPSMKLVLPWYFKNEIVARESDYLNAGGKLFFPMPYPHIVSSSGEIAI